MNGYFCSVPYIYTLEITSNCNANCVGCGNVFRHDTAYIKPYECQIILERIAQYAEMLRITGGEPTTSPVFAEILLMVDNLRKPFVVFTNGFWEVPERVIETLTSCKHLDGILVSLHGHCATAYQSFTQGKHFPLVLENIQRASEAGITVNTNTILTHETIYHMQDVIELATQVGAQVVAFSRYYGKPITGLTDLTPAQYRFAVDQVAQFRAQGRLVKFNNNIPLCLGGQLTQACPAGDTHCTISPTCDVRLCNHAPDAIGSILETPIEELWRSEKVRRWRAQIPAACNRCVAFDLCRGGCRSHARANGQETDPLMVRPYETLPEIPSPVHHTLYAHAFPVANFSLHKEHFGYVLINRSQILKVDPTIKPLLDVLQSGKKTLADITDSFGQEALNFIGLLYDNRMVKLKA